MQFVVTGEKFYFPLSLWQKNCDDQNVYCDLIPELSYLIVLIWL